MLDIHDRMPAILTNEAEDLWLDQGIDDPNLLKSLLGPYDSKLMKAYEISSLVNSPKNNVAEIIKPLNY